MSNLSNPALPEPQSASSSTTPEATESFGEIFSAYERAHAHPTEEGGGRQLEATVVAVSADSVYLDIGFKTEGVLPLTAFSGPVKPGDTFAVSVKGRNAEGYYELTRFKTAQPKDWASLEQAFAAKTAIVGTVTAAVKGGLSVDVGVRAFMPASRSGARDAAEMEKLVGQEIRCRILKLDVADEDVVVDRRAVLEEEERAVGERRYAELREGDTVHGTVRSLTDYGAFVDLGGVDGLLHVSDIAWSRVANPADVLAVGQELEARVLKMDTEKRRISLGLKQLQPHPWDVVGGKYVAGERVRGTVTRVMDFGAFVELEPGVEGLIHVSEMSWARKVRKASDLLKPGEVVEAVVLSIDTAERRIGLGLKQTLGDPWADAARRFPVGSQVEGTVTSLMKFGAFVQLAEGIEGLIHVSEMSAEKHIHHPEEVLKVGQTVKAQLLELDPVKRQIRLSMKQLLPIGLDEYIAEHKPGDAVAGRVVEITGSNARVELGERIYGTAGIAGQTAAETQSAAAAKPDLSALSSMLKARWKGSDAAGPVKPDAVQPGQIRSFRIVRLDAAAKTIELKLA